jgi:1-phosphofructokinase
MRDGDILVLSGSIPAGVSTDIYRVWTEKAKKSGVKVFLDADGLSFEEGIKGKPYLIKPNLEELERLLSRKLCSMEEIVRAGRSMLEMGIEIVAISLGSDGAMFFYGEQVIFAKGIQVDVKSTVGAGDAMVAALAFAISSGDSFEKAVILSVASGTANVACEGTQPPDRNAVAQYETQVEINYL